MSEEQKEEPGFFDKVGTDVRRNRMEASSDAIPVSAAPPGSGKGPVSVEGGTSWASSGDAYWRVGKNYQTLPPGVYRCGIADGIGPFFSVAKNDTDRIIRFPDSESNRLLEEMERFQVLRPKFQKHGFLHKRGILLWGPPGGGKTTTIQLLIELVVKKHGGVAVLVDRPSTAVACLQTLRSVEPERQAVGILEDLDALVERYGESEYLALLDGETQVDRMVWVATTNYPERLDRRFVDRPSRFDTIREIGMPSPEARFAYFLDRVPELSTMEIQAFVDASDGYSVAHMRELIILTQCFEQSLKDAKERLDSMRKKVPNSTHSSGKPGFGITGDAVRTTGRNSASN